jgi:hypothetical protein
MYFAWLSNLRLKRLLCPTAQDTMEEELMIEEITCTYRLGYFNPCRLFQACTVRAPCAR